ncbi:MAG: GNAT family N-acetyltransferase [Sphingobium sp.]
MWKPTPEPRRSFCLETERMWITACSEFEPRAYADTLVRNRLHIDRYMPDEILNLGTGEVDAFLDSLGAAWDAGDALCFVAIDKSSMAFRAQIYVQPIDRPADIVEIGYFADVDSQGHGFVTEAVGCVSRFLFERTSARKICLICDVDNRASIGVAERCGYVLEGTLRAHALNKDGTRPDRRFYARLPDDP